MGKKSKRKSQKKAKDDDLILDFSWLKNIFNIKKTKSTKKKKDEDITLDFKSLAKTFSKYSVFFLILIPLVMSTYIRLIPVSIPLADTWARQGIYNGIQNQIVTDINRQYPNLPQANKQAMVNEQFNLILSQQTQQIEQAVIQQADQIRARFRDGDGYTYLGDIDSYFWVRYARNIIENGHIGDEIREGLPYDNHMLAPTGSIVSPNIYPYIEATLYNFFRLFQSNINLMYVAFLTPLFLSFFAIIAAFFIGKKISGNLAGFIAAVLIAVNPTVLSRSLGSDNDIVNAVFPLIIMLFIIYAFDSDSFKKTIVYALLSGLFIGVYSFAWSGWWFMFLFTIGAAVIYIGYLILFDFSHEGSTIKNILTNNKLKNVFLLLVVFLLSSFISLTIFGNGDSFFRSFLNPLNIVQIKEVTGASLWPNVYTTVAELNAANIPQIIANLGGPLFLIIALIGTILPVMNLKEKKTYNLNIVYIGVSIVYFLFFVQIAQADKLNIFLLLPLLSLPLFFGLLLSVYFGYKIEPKHSILMTIWFMATIYAATKGVRFILLIIPAFVISFSTFLGILVHHLSKFIHKTLDINLIISKTIFTIVSIIVLLQPINIGIATASNYVPSVSDAWVDTLTKIKVESSPDAIINSWWDFGHWFKFWADRRVTFDGGSQTSPQAHWIGKVLLTDNEDQAVAILRMLDCGGNGAYNELNKHLDDTYISVNKIYDFFGMEKIDIKTELLEITTKENTEKIISNLFCEPPENYFITSGDMVGKSGVWAHFGSWNFERAKLYNYFKTETYDGFVQQLVGELEYNEEDAQKKFYELNSLVTDRQVNDWIAPWPSYGGSAECAKQNDELIQCNLPAQQNQLIPLTINLTTHDAYVNSGQEIFYANKLGYFEGDNYIIKDFEGSKIGYGIVLAPNNRTIYFMSEELVGSMFTRLFYLNGQGLNYFDKFHDVTSVGGSRIITWKIDWP